MLSCLIHLPIVVVVCCVSLLALAVVCRACFCFGSGKFVLKFIIISGWAVFQRTARQKSFQKFYWLSFSKGIISLSQNMHICNHSIYLPLALILILVHSVSRSLLVPIRLLCMLIFHLSSKPNGVKLFFTIPLRHTYTKSNVRRSSFECDFIYLALWNFSNFMTNINIFGMYLLLLIYKIEFVCSLTRMCMHNVRVTWDQTKCWNEPSKSLNSYYVCTFRSFSGIRYLHMKKIHVHTHDQR